MPRGARPRIDSIPAAVLGPYLAGSIGYREVARRLGEPRNTVLRTLSRLGHKDARPAIDRQGMQSRERWEPVPVPEYAAAYQVSNRGRVRRFLAGPGARPGKVLRPTVASGNPGVNLSANGVKRSFGVSTLVAGAFLPPPPSPACVLGHRNGDNLDCSAGNLYWRPYPEANRELRGRTRKLPDEALPVIRAARGHKSAVQLAVEHGVSVPTIYVVWAGKSPYRSED